MTGTSQPVPTAAAAREAARTRAGQFGQQHHSAPEMAFEGYPPLPQGLQPDQVDLNIWYDENESGQLVWQVSAYPIRRTVDGFEETNTQHGLFDHFELTVTDEQAEDLSSDHWTTLSQAPDWLRDAALPHLTGGAE